MLLVRVRRRYHARHLRVAVQALVLRQVVPLEVGLERGGQLNRAQVRLRLHDRRIAIGEVVAACDLRVKRLDVDAARITPNLLARRLVQPVNRSTVQVLSLIHI